MFQARAATFYVFLAAAFAVCGTGLIFGKSLTNPNGYITNDSASYLQLAQRLLDGHGFTITNSGLNGAEDIHFATWPVGYSSLIAGTAAVLGLTPFLASKLVNGLCLVLCMYAVARSFGAAGPVMAMIFLFAGTLETFSYTWSEAPFTLLLTLFAILLARFMGERPPGIVVVLGLITCAITLFMIRYIGLFAVGPILLVAMIALSRKVVVTALGLGSAAAFTGSAAFAYLSYNKLATGFSTGVMRAPSGETNLELLSALGHAIVHELVLPIPFWVASEIRHNVLLGLLVLGCLFVIVKVTQSTVQKPASEYRHLCLSFLLVGLSYLGAIIIARWNAAFDPFGYRLLNPGTTLVLVGLFGWLFGRYPAARPAIGLLLTSMACLSLAVHAIMLKTRALPGGYAAARCAYFPSRLGRADHIGREFRRADGRP